MERKVSTALVAVPTASTAIALRKPKQESKLLLADGDVILTNREEVRNRLPDILGRALARAWLDLQFEKDFMRGPLTGAGGQWCAPTINYACRGQ